VLIGSITVEDIVKSFKLEEIKAGADGAGK
jgi:hypothetical protein